MDATEVTSVRNVPNNHRSELLLGFLVSESVSLLVMTLTAKTGAQELAEVQHKINRVNRLWLDADFADLNSLNLRRRGWR